MELKSLVLCPFVGLMAASTVQAADLVSVEPEPANYVRVCDMYGAGYMYIPGTETCMKMSGELRVQYNYSSRDMGKHAPQKPEAAEPPVKPLKPIGRKEAKDLNKDLKEVPMPNADILGAVGFVDEEDFSEAREDEFDNFKGGIEEAEKNYQKDEKEYRKAKKDYRKKKRKAKKEFRAARDKYASWKEVGEATWYGRVNFDVRRETDYGTHRTYMRLEGKGGSNSSESDVYVRDAYIELGGLSVGYRTSRAELTGLPGQMFDGNYHGGGRVMYADYTMAANGFSVTGGASLDNVDSESVDYYIRSEYSSDMFTIGGVYAHDSSEENGSYGGYAKLTPLEGLTLQAYYNGQTGKTQFGSNNYDSYDQWGVGASYAINDKLTVSAGYYQGENWVAWDKEAFNLSPVPSDGHGYSANLAWTIVPNLVMQLGYNREEFDDLDGTEDNYRIRFQSNF